ncbi:hypothetical protein [Hyalangium versicolor]|nr:hypothetical protein [Hyalangium versicolor]
MDDCSPTTRRGRSNYGKTTHNYRDMNSIIHSDCKDVVIVVPKNALQRN